MCKVTFIGLKFKIEHLVGTLANLRACANVRTTWPTWGSKSANLRNINLYFSRELFGKFSPKGVVRQISTFSRPYAPMTHVCTRARVLTCAYVSHVCTCVRTPRFARLTAKAVKDHRPPSEARSPKGDRASLGWWPTYQNKVNNCTCAHVLT